MKARILIVEDEPQLGMGLQFNLEAEGNEVLWVDNGFDALDWLIKKKAHFDLVILDVMMEGIDGLEVCRRVRAAKNYVPIMMLTAKDLLEDRVDGLDAGADDYLTKPFALEELLARTATLLRRQAWLQKQAEPEEIGPDQLSFGDNYVDFKTHRAKGAQGAVNLTAMEISVLKYLSARPGEVVSRRDLLENVWGVSGDMATRTVDNFMVRIRRMFERDPRSPEHFRSVRGVGYRFTPERD